MSYLDFREATYDFGELVLWVLLAVGVVVMVALALVIVPILILLWLFSGFYRYDERLK